MPTDEAFENCTGTIRDGILTLSAGKPKDAALVSLADAGPKGDSITVTPADTRVHLTLVPIIHVSKDDPKNPGGEFVAGPVDFKNNIEAIPLYGENAFTITGSQTRAGSKAVASDSKAVASDSKAVASDSKAVASDSKAVASESKAVASGSKAMASESKAVASGSKAMASGSKAVASGSKAVASGSKAMASGSKAVANNLPLF